MGFVMVTGFIEFLQKVTTSNYRAFANSRTQQFTTSRTRSSQPAVSSPVIVLLRLPTADVPLPLGSRTIAVPQLPASNSNSSQGLNRSSPLTHSLTNQLAPLRYTELHCTALTELKSVSCVI
jgi:hypothetical protein